MNFAGQNYLSSIFPGYQIGQQNAARIQQQQLANQDAIDARRASLAALIDSSGVDPTTATIMALSGGNQPATSFNTTSPPQATGSPVATPNASGVPTPTATPPAGGPSPSPMAPQPASATPTAAAQPHGMALPFMGGQMSLGQMLRRLKADPKNQGIPDVTLLGLAAKAQAVLHPDDRLLLQYIMQQNLKNTVTPYQQQTLKDREKAESDRHEVQQQLMDIRNNLQQNAQLSDDDAKFLAQQRIAGDKSALTGLGYGNMGAINRRKVISAMRGVLQDKFGKGADGSLVAETTAAYMGDTAAIRAISTQAARTDSGAIEMKKFAPLVEQASQSIDRTKFPSINSMELAVQKGTGGQNVIRLIDSINAFKNAYAQVVSRGGASSVDARLRADEVINKAWSSGQIQAAIDQLNKEANAAIASMHEARQAVVGDISGGAPGATPLPTDNSGVPPNASDGGGLPPGWSVKVK